MTVDDSEMQRLWKLTNELTAQLVFNRSATLELKQQLAELQAQTSSLSPVHSPHQNGLRDSPGTKLRPLLTQRQWALYCLLGSKSDMPLLSLLTRLPTLFALSPFVCVGYCLGDETNKGSSSDYALRIANERLKEENLQLQEQVNEYERWMGYIMTKFRLQNVSLSIFAVEFHSSE